MDKLIVIVCELAEKIDKLVNSLEHSQSSNSNNREHSQGSNVESSLFVVSNIGEPQKLTGENNRRVEVWVHNASDRNFYLAPTSDDDIGPNRYSLAISPGDTLVINSHSFAHLYKKEIYGFWDNGVSANANAMITEFFTTE